MNWKPFLKWGVAFLVVELLFLIVLTTDSILSSGKLPIPLPKPGCPNAEPELEPNIPKKQITQIGRFRCYDCH